MRYEAGTTSVRPLEWQGARLRFARAAWFSMAAPAIVALLASIPAYVGSVGIFTETERYVASLLVSPLLFSPAPQFEFWNDVGYELLSFGAAGLSLGLAALIFLRRPKEPVAFAVSLTLLFYGVVMAGPLEMLVGQRPAGELLALFAQILLSGFFVFLFFIFPDGRFVPGWTRWLSPLLIPWVLALARWQSALHDVAAVGPYLVVYTLPPLAACVVQIYRFRRVSNAVERQQTKWVVVGFTAWAVGGTAVAALMILLVTRLASFTTPAPTAWSSGLMFAARLVWPLSLTFVPLSLAVAILRYRLWDIDLIIRRTLIYGALTALLALVYLGAVVGLQGVFTALGGQRRSDLVTVISTLTIAALFVPLRHRLQAFIDHRFYRSKYDAARVLAQYGQSVRDDVDLDELTEGLLAAVDRTMQPAHAALWLARAVAPSTGHVEDSGQSTSSR